MAKKQKKYFVGCHIPCVRCYVSGVMCWRWVSPVTYNLPLKPTATFTDPPPANSLIIHSIMVRRQQTLKKNTHTHKNQ